jgi:hypothetical protein
VSTEISAIRPTDEYAAEWWAAEGAQTDLSLAVTPSGVVERRTDVQDREPGFLGRLATRMVAMFTGVVRTARHYLP